MRHWSHVPSWSFSYYHVWQVIGVIARDRLAHGATGSLASGSVNQKALPAPPALSTPHLPAMPLNDPAAHIQAQAQIDTGAMQHLDAWSAVIALEKARQRVRPDPLPVVAHLDMCHAVLAPERQRDHGVAR